MKREGYDRAVVLTSDGDFGVLVKYLKDHGRRRAVLSPNCAHTSFLLRKTTGSEFSVRSLDALQGRFHAAWSSSSSDR